MFLVGFFAAFMFVPIIPEMIDALEEQEQKRVAKEKGIDKVKVSKNP